MTQSRREFVRASVSCAAHLSALGAMLPVGLREEWRKNMRQAGRLPVIAQEPWGRLERVADGVWALVSTPLGGDWTTLCNGGIVAGRNGTLVVEAFNTDNGARWMAAQARALTGRAPTHVVLTHYHSDHAAGLRGVFDTADVGLHATATTRDTASTKNRNAPTELLARARAIDGGNPTRIDLGGRTVTLRPTLGHTASDVAIEVDDPHTVFCGDLVWNGMFPNFVDASPAQLSASVRALRDLRAATYVPGHGSVASPAELDRYVSVLDLVEAAARRAMEQGSTAQAAADAFAIPSSLGDWHRFSESYYLRAISAWMRELSAR